MNDIHLTAEQLDQMLCAHDSDRSPSGLLPPAAAREHLQSCAACRQELEQLGSTLGNLRSAAFAWAALEAPSFDPSHRLREKPVAARARPSRLAWGGGIGSLALAAGLLVTVHHVSGRVTVHPRNLPASAQTTSPASPSDEALLTGVESDLADWVPPSLAPLSVTASR